MSVCMCVHIEVKPVVCLSPTFVCVCVYCVLVCMMAFTPCAKWLRPTECSRGIYTLNHTVQHCNTKGNRKWGGERSRNTSHRQTGSVAWKSVPWQSPVAMTPSRQNAVEGNKLDFKINVPLSLNSLLLWTNSCEGQTTRYVCCIGVSRLCLVWEHKWRAQKLIEHTETCQKHFFFILKPVID